MGDGAENGMDDEQPVDLGVALFIPYRYMEERILPCPPRGNRSVKGGEVYPIEPLT